MSLILKSPDLKLFAPIITGASSLSSVFNLTADGGLSFDAGAIDFNGTSSYVSYPNNLFGGWGWNTSGMTGGQTKGITVSLWIKPASGITSDSRRIVSHFKSSTSYGKEDNNILVTYDASGNARFTFSQQQNSSGNEVLVQSAFGDLTTDSWNHILLRISMNTSEQFTSQLYINDSNISHTAIPTGELESNSPDNDDTTWLGKFDEGVALGYYDGCLSELWIDDTIYDLSVQSNRRLFIDSSGKPVELPTSPLIYLNGSSSTWTNSGTYSLGTQTLNSITDCADSPSD
jgi:hypothetical protein